MLLMYFLLSLGIQGVYLWIQPVYYHDMRELGWKSHRNGQKCVDRASRQINCIVIPAWCYIGWSEAQSLSLYLVCVCVWHEGDMSPGSCIHIEGISPIPILTVNQPNRLQPIFDT